VFISLKNKKLPLLADHRADGHGPPVVHGPQVEDRWFRVSYIYAVVFFSINSLISMQLGSLGY